MNAIVIQILFLSLIHWAVSIASDNQPKNRYAKEGAWTIRPNSPEAYFINMDKSSERRKHMENHLKTVGLRYFRVRGNPWNEIYIPPDVHGLWQTAWCNANTQEVIPARAEVFVNKSSHLFNYSSIMAGLCGRGHDKFGKEKNTIKELGCTTSHLLAMKMAIYSKTAKSRYALIIEDDVKLPFDVDFEALAESAPKGFGILQLFNSNKVTMLHTWKRYVADNTKLWYRSENLKYWSTCGYLIDREVLKPIVDAVAYEKDGWQVFKVIAGINGPCAPKGCCVNGSDTRWGYWGKDVQFVADSPCVFAGYGFQADSFLYAMAPTYMLSVPLIANGKGGNASTFHQDHVELLHRAAFKQQRQIINDMVRGHVPPPLFAKPAIKMSLNESQM